MKVGYDRGLPLREPTGVSRYVSELGEELQKLDVDLHPFLISLRAPHVSGSSRWRLPATPLQAWWRLVPHPSIERLLGQVDLVHGPNFVLPPLERAKGVLTIHDLSFCKPEYMGVNRRLSAMVPWSVRQADAVVVPATVIREEVASSYGVGEEAVHVTPMGVSQEFFDAVPADDCELEALGIRRPFLLAVGTIQPRKNLHRLLEAWQQVASKLPDWSIVLVGPKGWGPEPPEAPRVALTGWLSDTALIPVLAAADIFCYPSLYEGFGLPPLEAMAAGTASLVGDYSVAAEVVGDDVLTVKRYEVGSIAEGLMTLARDDGLRARLATEGRRRARSFTWEKCARATLDAYEAVVGG